MSQTVAVGQVWKNAHNGARFKVVSINPPRVAVVSLETGNREWVHAQDLVASAKIVRAHVTKNPGETYRKGERVRVVDRESPWVGRVGEVIDNRPEYFMVRFKGDPGFGFHDRYMTTDQVVRTGAEKNPKRNPDSAEWWDFVGDVESEVQSATRSPKGLTAAEYETLEGFFRNGIRGVSGHVARILGERAAKSSRPSRNPKGRNAGPAVGSYWQRLEYPQHLARVVSLERAGGGAPPMVNLEVVTGRGAVMGQSRIPVNDLHARYEPLPPSSPYRKTLPQPNPSLSCACGAFDGDLPSIPGLYTYENGYAGAHSGDRCFRPDVPGDGRGVLYELGKKPRRLGYFPAWANKAIDVDGLPRKNPTFRVRGTLTADLAPARGSARPRRRLAAGKAVHSSARLLPAAPRAPRAARAPRAPRAPRGKTFAAGEYVTVPYMGRASYFGKRVKKTRERAQVQGMTDSDTGGPAVLVEIQRGKRAETHTVPVHLVRRAPRRDRRPTTVRFADKAEKLAREFGSDVNAMGAELGRLEAERENLYDVMRATYPQRGARPTLEYSRAQRRAAEVRRRGDILSALIQKFAPDSAAFGGFDVSSDGTNGPRINPRGSAASDLAGARRVVEMWSERPAGKVRRMKGPKRLPKALAELGELVSVVYRSDKYDGKSKLYEHKTKRPRPVLAADPDGQHVHIVGGRMKITADGLVN